MKILLDECLPLDFRLSFPGNDAHSAEWAGLKGRKNGELLREAEFAGYEVLFNRGSRNISPIRISLVENFRLSRSGPGQINWKTSCHWSAPF